MTMKFLDTERRKDSGTISVLFLSFLHHLKFFFPLSDAIITSPGMQLQVSEAGMISR